VNVGANIKTARELKKLSRDALADLVGTSGEYIRHVEAGRRVPSLEMLLKLTLALGIKPGTLLKEG
jgi:transcriptional regulator with XRE-family HTH domain